MRHSLTGPPVRGQEKKIMNLFRKRAGAAISALCLLIVSFMSFMLSGCGGGGEGVSTQVVSGVVAVGAPLAGEAKIKDSSQREKKTVIGSDGSFAFDVSDMKGPFILQATGFADGETHTLQSFADNPGTANINPLANAVVANAAGVDDPAKIYESPNRDKLDKIKSELPVSIAEILDKLKPLLKKYNADNSDPVRGDYKADHNNLDGLFDNVKITLVDGILTIINKKTGAVIFTGKISDIKNGDFDEGNLPDPGDMPDHPGDVKAVGGAGQVTVSWKAVGNAISYNIYWSTTSPVTKTTGTKIAGVTSPYLHTGLAAGTKCYYIVTAVNSAGEGEASDQASATTTSEPAPNPTVPAAPTGVIATGGTKQVTVSWPAVTGAASYNIYWSTTSGVTKATGAKITGAISPLVQNGLPDNTTYYYIVTAVNNAGEGDPSVQVAARTLDSMPAPTLPSAPTGVSATGGANQVTVSWSLVTGASSYNIYWSTTSGVTKTSGTKIAGTTSPYVHAGLPAGATRYYIVTAVNGVGESDSSAEATATTAPTTTTTVQPTTVPTTISTTVPTTIPSTSTTTVPTTVPTTIATTSTTTVPTTIPSTSTTTAPTTVPTTIATTSTTTVPTTIPSTSTTTAPTTVPTTIATTSTTTTVQPTTTTVATTTTTTIPALACGTCHAIPPVNGAHAFHTSRGISCSICHGSGYSDTTVNSATHINGAINIAGGIGWNATSRSCNNSCHGSKNW
jgi:hypothetical protein